jgi:hypothetical protein
MLEKYKKTTLSLEQSYSLAGLFFYQIGYFLTEDASLIIAKYKENPRFSESEITQLKSNLKSNFDEREKEDITFIFHYFVDDFYEDWAEAVKRALEKKDSKIELENFKNVVTTIEETFESFISYVELNIEEMSFSSVYLLELLRSIQVNPEKYNFFWVIFENELENVLSGDIRSFEWDGTFIDYKKKEVSENKKTKY